MAAQWWRDAVIYQVYVKSFADNDGDGVGDLDGLAGRLDHLARLGVDGLWLNPCYPSPGHDGGYDVADYLRIDDGYGGTAALDRLVAQAHEAGLRVLMDIVPNHCSEEHPWFQAALAEPPGGPHRARFVFRDGREDGRLPPNNWQSAFGGPAWTRLPDRDGQPGQWYLHLFDPTQPDFDWRHPDVGRYFEEILRYWFDRGIDGFRIDVAAMLFKAANLPDRTPGDELAPPDSNQPEVHDVYRAWRRLADTYERELVFVGEVWAPTPAAVTAFVRPDELQQVFYFDLMLQPWSAQAFRASVGAGLTAIDSGSAGSLAGTGTLAWALNCHDAHRSASRYGLVDPAGATGPVLRQRGPVDIPLGQARARAALLFLLGLPGAIFLYQGEELGLPEVMDLPDDARQDPIWIRTGGPDYGRDGCRVPLPWNADAPHFGFSTGQPWLPQPEWFAGYAADRQESDPGSMLSLYRSALARRRELFTQSTVEWLETGRDDVIAYRRGQTIVATVFAGDAWPIPAEWGRVELSSVDTVSGSLPAPGSVWLRS